MSADPINFILYSTLGIMAIVFIYVVIKDIMKDWDFIRRMKNASN